MGKGKWEGKRESKTKTIGKCHNFLSLLSLFSIKCQPSLKGFRCVNKQAQHLCLSSVYTLFFTLSGDVGVLGTHSCPCVFEDVNATEDKRVWLPFLSRWAHWGNVLWLWRLCVDSGACGCISEVTWCTSPRVTPTISTTVTDARRTLTAPLLSCLPNFSLIWGAPRLCPHNAKYPDESRNTQLKIPTFVL